MGVGDGGDGNLSSIWTPGGKMTMTAMIIVTALLILLFFHLYSRLFLRPREPYSPPRPPVIRHRPLVFVETRPSTISTSASSRGLDPIILESISPVFVFHNDGEIGIMCAVCLGEIEEGELARIVPKCGHGFHVECIDMWLATHATCPLCRAAVEPIRKQELGIDSKAPRAQPGGETAAPELDLERGMVAQWAPPVTSRRERE